MKYKHYPKDKAKAEYQQGQRKKYKVTTINWVYAGQDKEKIDYSKVHKNEYIWTLRYLKRWIFECYGDVPEDIISIEPIENEESKDDKNVQIILEILKNSKKGN
ncbi:hypothetical protein ACFL4Z_02940 [candidate division KSB1 bacterium]